MSVDECNAYRMIGMNLDLLLDTILRTFTKHVLRTSTKHVGTRCASAYWAFLHTVKELSTTCAKP